MIAIASTFVAEPLGPALAWLLKEAGLQDEISFAPYHQVFQELLTPTSTLRDGQNDANVLLIRLEDFIRDLPHGATCEQTVRSLAEELPHAFEQFAAASKAPILLAVLPPGPAASRRYREGLLEAGERLVRRARSFPHVQVIDDADVVGPEMIKHCDPSRDRLAHIPYTDEFYANLALAAARRIHAVRNTPSKVLVLDCDNTLWRGVVGEDGADGVQITPECLALQDFAIEQEGKGVLICLLSKNSERDVLSVFETRPEMHLRQSHLVSYRINWLSKPVNIRSLAEELNLGLDSFVFLDDNPVECAQMRAEQPEVITIQIPEEPVDSRLLRNLWMFDRLSVTGEDTIRTKMYAANAARRTFEKTTGDITQFLAALDMKIDIAPPQEEEWPRLAQLTLRTNQFNFTTRRRTESELRSLQHNGATVLRVRFSDRFGEYGIVGLLIAEGTNTELGVDTFLLSCRALGRGVEHAMLRRLGEVALSAGLKHVSLPYVPTERNTPARAFADDIAGGSTIPSPPGHVYFMPAGFALAVEHRPGQDPSEVVQAARSTSERKSAVAAPNTAARSENYARLARTACSGKSVLAEMARQSRRTRRTAMRPATPESAVEQQLAQLWASLLNIDSIGADEDFFELGGTSLLSVKLIAEVSEIFKIELPLSAMVEAPTIRTLGRLIEATSRPVQPGMVCLRAGGPENMFLVHDGLGETLLYRNLARRMPPAISVYGIEPTRLPGIPLAHGSIAAMARSYVEKIRRVQPKGPYVLGGMCAGGVIAHEMAACLSDQGESVRLVAILDGATPQARKRAGINTGQRLSRIKQALAQQGTGSQPMLVRWMSIALMLARKTATSTSYLVSSTLHELSVRWRVALMKQLLKRGAAWPKALAPLNVQEIYDVLGSEHTPRALTSVPVLLVRASDGVGADRPFRELFSAEDLGWSCVASRLELADVKGGHSSMLQEHAIDSLASVLMKHLRGLNRQASQEAPVSP